jgi:Protein of unknown function (DUF2752)
MRVRRFNELEKTERVRINLAKLTNFFWARLFLISLIFGLLNYGARKSENFTTGPILCTFRIFTGLPCPFCGTTRAFGALSQGDFFESFSLNPLAIVITFVALLWAVQPTILGRAREAIARFWWRVSDKTRYLTFSMFFLTIWIFNLPRMLVS